MKKANIRKMQYGGTSQFSFQQPFPTSFSQVYSSFHPQRNNEIYPQYRPLSDSYNKFKQEADKNLRDVKFQAGLTLLGSKNYEVDGQQLIQEALKLPQSKSYINPSIVGKSLKDKFSQSTFGRNFDFYNSLGGAANELFTTAFGEKNEYQGDKGAITQGLDKSYDTIQSVASSFGPIGQMVSLGMSANKLLGNVANKLGGGTDGMTTTDAILGSSFLQLTPFGLINGFGGKNADTITKNDLAFENVGSSYTGTYQTVNDALQKSGKKYGLFSRGELNDANQQINSARIQQDIMSDISDEAMDRRAIRNSMAAINGNTRDYKMRGGYKQGIGVGRNGMILQTMDRVKKILNNRTTNKFQQGGQLKENTIATEILLVNPQDVPEFQQGGQVTPKERTLQELIDYAKEVNPRFIQRMSEPLKYVEWDDENGHHFGTHELGYTEMDGKYFIYPLIQEDSDGNLVRYPQDKWEDARDNAYKNKNGLFFNTEEEAKIFTESQENPDGTFSGYKSGWPDFFKQKPAGKYQNGGSINVIPDGALHARKHNMDMEGITKKGIPVVTEKDGEIEQQAEIEKEEIIFRLEVTKKLEELQKKYYDNETSQKEKDQYALEAGKLLVKEILSNTKDNTNNLL